MPSTPASEEQVLGVILTHVDDLLLLAAEPLRELVKTELSSRFPVEGWKDDKFEYTGCSYEFHEDRVTVSQAEYARTRVDKVKIPPDLTSEDLAPAVAVEENRTAIGSVSWLAKQTRPDLQFMVAQAQRKQNRPTIGDLRDTDKLVDAALRHQDCGLTLRRIEEKELAILAYHDAAWGNVEAEGTTQLDQEWQGNHTVASQLGSLTMLVERQALQGTPARFSIVDWKSKASARVCRSTFAGETMSACDALESALYLRGLWASLSTGR